tara:strand:- start:867 stop:1403 length:537 start_codon:yes stop_codon:yes gene_type:complete
MYPHGEVRIIHLTANEIAKVIKDYDVCYSIAKLFIAKRREESETKARKWHHENLIKQVYSEYTRAAEVVGVWLRGDLRGQGQSERIKNLLSINRVLPDTFPDENSLKTYRKQKDPYLERNIKYMVSERGIRTDKWRLYCSIWFKSADEFNNPNVDFRRKAKDIDMLNPTIINKFLNDN